MGSEQGSVVAALVQVAQFAGLLHHRGHQVLGQDLIAGELAGKPAEIPLSEITTLTTFIRQTTQGRGWFTTEFARYEVLPENLVAGVVEQAKKLGNLDESADD